MASLKSLNPYERHKLILEEYILRKPTIEKRDIDIIRENHKFIWDEELAESELTWREQLARKYYDKLFKEYCICDLSRYKENKVAMRWRTEKEVIAGKGQFVCSHKPCNLTEELRTWEVNFAYLEKKNALVKLRLCPKCSDKLNYRSQKREIKRAKKINQKSKKLKTKTNKIIPLSSDEQIEESVLANFAENEMFSSSIKCAETDEEEASVNNEEDGISNWKTLPADDTEPTRETEFEKYLEDLLF